MTVDTLMSFIVFILFLQVAPDNVLDIGKQTHRYP